MGLKLRIEREEEEKERREKKIFAVLRGTTYYVRSKSLSVLHRSGVTLAGRLDQSRAQDYRGARSRERRFRRIVTHYLTNFDSAWFLSSLHTYYGVLTAHHEVIFSYADQAVS